MELEHSILLSEKYLLFNVWVTTDCNFQCEYCYEKTEKRKRYMNDDAITKVVELIVNICTQKNISVVWINFHGGEPLLNKKWIVLLVEMIRKEKKFEKVHTSMTTNGTLYVPEILTYIDELSVSIDGNENSHDINRRWKSGKATFHDIYVNVKKYLNIIPNLRVRMVITPQTVSRLKENIIFLINEGFRIIIPGIDYFNTGWEEEHFEIMYEQLKLVEEYRNQNGRNDLIIGILDTPIKRIGHCVIGEDGFQIYSDGKIYPCTYSVGKKEYVIGTLEDGIDQNSIQCLNQRLEQDVKECEGCQFYHFCTTKRCYFLNEAIVGNFYTPSGVVCATENVRIKLSEINGKKDS